MVLNAILWPAELASCILVSITHAFSKLTSSEKMLDVVSAAKIIDNHIKYQASITLGSICMTSVSPRHVAQTFLYTF